MTKTFELISKPSPNCDERNHEHNVDILVMHYTGMKSGKEALERMCDAQAEVSAHYMVEEDGAIYQLVEEHKRAWHAGISCWKGRALLNHSSIGIEIVNPGHEWGYRPFPKVQMESVIKLAKDILSRYDIPPENVVGHSDIAPTRKQDPGELFDWKWLAREGVGLWPEEELGWKKKDEVLVSPYDEGADVAFVQRRLAAYGYHIRVDGYYGPKMEAVVKAYKRHFVPEQLNTQWDRLSDVRLDALLKLIEMPH